MAFVIRGIDPSPYRVLWALDDEALARQQARRVTVTECPGFPDRVGLDDVPVGETVLLVNHEHLPVDSPYRSRYAVYLRRSADAPAECIDTVPPALARRTLSVRAFSSEHCAVDARLVEGHALAPVLDAMLAQPLVAYVHVHYATFGCFAARAERASGGAVR